MPRLRLSCHLCLVALAAAFSAACATASSMTADAPEPAACRAALTMDGESASVQWIRPEDPGDRLDLDVWCAGVGPAVVAPAPATSGPTADSLVIVSWNTNVGAGDVAGLVRELRSGRLTNGRPVAHFVLLLQEVYRAGTQVPTGARGRIVAASRRQPHGRSDQGSDVQSAAASLGLALHYAPSMRNGAPHETREDRGNAILSTLPLTDLSAIELPFERQRRVAIEANVHGTRATGEPWTLRVTSAHLDNRAPAKRFWLFATMSRVRQARGLVQAMRPTGAAALGGDLNSWGGFNDAAYHAIAERLPIESSDRRATFLGLARLDHLLFRLPDGWTAVTRRLERFGSDHHPLLAEITVR